MDRTAQGVVPGLERLMVLERVRGPGGDAGGVDALLRAVRVARFELIPLAGTLDLALAALRPGATVTVTSSPTKGLEPTIALCEDLTNAGFVAIPHLAARAVRDGAHLSDVLARLDAAAIRRVFVVGGDDPQPGAFPDGLSLLRALEETGRRFDEIGIPGYPEGHPAIATETLWGALLDKQPHAHSIATQLCFDAGAIAGWIGEARRRGVTLPIEIGIPGPAELSKVLRISAKIGVADAARYVRKNRGLFGAVLRRRAFRPDQLLRDLAPAIREPGTDVRGLHVYTFNQVRAAAEWQRRTLERLA